MYYCVAGRLAGVTNFRFSSLRWSGQLQCPQHRPSCSLPRASDPEQQDHAIPSGKQGRPTRRPFPHCPIRRHTWWRVLRQFHDVRSFVSDATDYPVISWTCFNKKKIKSTIALKPATSTAGRLRPGPGRDATVSQEGGEQSNIRLQERALRLCWRSEAAHGQGDPHPWIDGSDSYLQQPLSRYQDRGRFSCRSQKSWLPGTPEI